MVKNILLIGFGHHARRIYYSVLKSEKDKYNFIIVDLISQKESIQEFLLRETHKPLDLLLLDQFSEKLSDVPKDILSKLAVIKRKYNPIGVIISTDPLYPSIMLNGFLKIISLF